MAKCFWCEKELTKHEHTKDHFISRPLWSYSQNKVRNVIPNRQPSCIACSHCNSRRGNISGLFLCAKKIKRASKGSFERRMREFLKGKQKLLKEIYDFRKKVEERVKNQHVKNLCLTEIDEILQLDFDHEYIAIKAYYLWEKEGRPHGRSDEFWLKAEKYVKTGHLK